MKYAENDKFDSLIRLAMLDCGKKDADEFDAIDTSGIELSDRLNKKIFRLIAKKKRESQVIAARRIFGRIAVAILLIVAIMLTAIACSERLREAIWNAIVEWYNDHIVVRYDEASDVYSGDDENDIDAYERSAAISPTAPDAILEVRKPTVLPEGVVEDIYVQSQWKVAIDYYLGGKIICSFQQVNLKLEDYYYNNDVSKIEEIQIGNYLASFAVHNDNGNKYIFWNDGEYSYVLCFSEMNIEQATAIAESVK